MTVAKPTSPESGSMLVETLIAVALVAIVLAAFFRVTGDNWLRSRGIEDRRRALLVAQSQLASVGAAIPVQDGQTTGRSDDLIWRVVVTPWQRMGTDSAVGGLHLVTVTVGRGKGREDMATLHTLALGAR